MDTVALHLKIFSPPLLVHLPISLRFFFFINTKLAAWFHSYKMTWLMLRLLPHTFAGSFRMNDSLSVTISSVRPIQRHFSKYDHSIISWFRMSKIDGSYSISLPNSSRKITSAVIGFLIEREATRFPTYFPITQGITRLKGCSKIKAPCYQDFIYLFILACTLRLFTRCFRLYLAQSIW